MTTFTTDDGAGTLRSWLIERVAVYLECEPGQVEPARSLADYGLHSMLALSLCADLEDYLQVQLEPTLVWDQPSIDALVAHLLSTVLASQDPGQ